MMNRTDTRGGATVLLLCLTLTLAVSDATIAETQPIASDWSALRREASLEYKARRYRKAAYALGAAIESATARKVDRCTVADMYDALAKVQQALGEREAVEQSLRASLRLRESARWSEHPDVRNTRTLLAMVLIDQDKLAEAEALVGRELAIENAQNEGAMANPRLIELMGDLEFRQRKYAAAGKHFEMLIAFEESRSQPRQNELRRWLSNLCGVYKELGKSAELIRSTNKMVELNRKNPTTSNITKASDQYSLAIIESSAPRKIEKLQNAYRLLKQEKGPQRLRVWTFSTLSGVMSEQHDMASAERYAMEAYREALRLDPIDKELLMQCAGNLAMIYRTTKRSDEAIDYFNKAFKIAERPISILASWHYEAAMIQVSRGKLASAKSEYDKAIAVLDQLSSQDQLRVWCVSGLAGCFESENNFEEAERKRVEALKLAKSLNDRSLAAACELNLAYLYHRKRDFKKAEKMALSCSQQIGLTSDALLHDALWLLATIYADEGEMTNARSTIKRICSKPWSAAIKKSSQERTKQFLSKYHLQDN